MLKLFLLIFVSLLFVACGSGSSTAPANEEPTVQIELNQAYLIDNEISNIDFITNSQSGVTDNEGGFEFSNDDTFVTFKVGNLEINTYQLSNLNDDKKIFPTDLAGVSRDDYNNTEVIKLLQIFQTLDSDNDPSNGIEIINDVKEKFLTSQTLDQIEVEEVATISEKPLVSQEIALNHFKDTLIQHNMIDLAEDTENNTSIDNNLTTDTDNEENNITSESNTSTTNKKPIVENLAFDVNENIANGTTIGNLVLISGDAPINSIVLKNRSDDSISTQFSASIAGTITTIATIDYESNSSYDLYAVASSSIGSSDEANISITINDLKNEVVPTLSSFSGSVEENITAGTEIGTITVTNSGNLDSNISAFTLIGSGAGNFEIDLNGTITLASGVTLDYETTPIYNLTLTATNLAGTSLAKAVAISVLNVAEIKPTLQSFSGSINEDASNNDIIGTINFIQGDSNISSFTLYDNDGVTLNDEFNISNDGVISVKDNTLLDYETKSSYLLKAKATNTAGDSNIVTVNININNISDTVPTLANFTKSINENIAAGTNIGSLNIIDSGDSNISFIVLKEVNGTMSSTFDIASDGTITTKANSIIDYELLNSRNYIYDLRAIAVNMAGDSNEVNVSISVNDVVEEAFTASVETNQLIQEQNSLYVESIVATTSNSVMTITGFDVYSDNPMSSNSLKVTISDLNLPVEDTATFTLLNYILDGITIDISSINITVDAPTIITSITFNITSTAQATVSPTAQYETEEYYAGHYLAEINASSAYAAGITGESVIVAVVDSGVDYNHTDLDDNILYTESQMDDGVAFDGLGHGTHVTGIIAAEKNDIGNHGVAYNAELITIKAIADSGYVDLNKVFDGITKATNSNAKVTNISINTTYWSLEYFTNWVDQMRSALDSDNSLIFAAGNNSEDNPDYPASLPAFENHDDLLTRTGAFISVVGLDRYGNVASYSNKAGTAAEWTLCAIGGDLNTSDYKVTDMVQSTKTGGGMTSKRGSSMAAPQVTAAFALIAEAHPELTGAEIRDVLFATATDLGEPSVDSIYGHGLLNIGAALDSLE